MSKGLHTHIMASYPPADVVREAGDEMPDALDSFSWTPKRDDIQGRVASRVPRAYAQGARITGVAPGSPADDRGFEPGCVILSVDGEPVRDIIDWRWLSSEGNMVLVYIDLDGETGEVELERDEGEAWGFSFEGVIFDGIRQCRNACTFCFMRQLPPGMRPSLTLRDDDFRLSFLSGTFVTLTNLTLDDEKRIIDQRITPLRVSLHAVDTDARRILIGRHAPKGLSTLDRLLAAGIEVHAQIVLVPGVNDGEVLATTLQWAYGRPGILAVGIVPLGYTKYQTSFDHSFNDPGDAGTVLAILAPYQRRAARERGTPWVFAADEFYRNAYRYDLLQNLPSAEHYGDFSMFEDGIGIIRSYVDDWREAEGSGLVARCARAIKDAGLRVHVVSGYAQREFFTPLLERSPLAGYLEPLYVKNEFFGGNVDVTGLLVGCDIVAAVRAAVSSADALVVVPRVIFNDDKVTLDDMNLEDMEKASGRSIAVVSCNPSKFLEEIAALI